MRPGFTWTQTRLFMPYTVFYCPSERHTFTKQTAICLFPRLPWRGLLVPVVHNSLLCTFGAFLQLYFLAETGKCLRNRVASISQEVNLNGSNVTDINFLGVTLDQDLSFNRQVEELCKQLAKRIGLLRHIRHYLKRHQREIYYSTIIKPVLLYGSTIWTSCSKENILKLLRLQKRAARIILDAERTSSSVSLFNTVKWVPFYVHGIVCKLVYFNLQKTERKYSGIYKRLTY